MIHASIVTFRRMAPTILALITCAFSAHAQPVTRVVVTDEVVLTDVVRFGLNTSAEDDFWDVPLRWVKMEENFEGGLHRKIYTLTEDGTGSTAVARMAANQLSSWNKVPDLHYTVVAGPSKWIEGTVLGLESLEGGNVRFRFDKELKLRKGDGVMLTGIAEGEGGFRRRGGRLLGDTEFVFNDAPKDSFGNTSLLLKADAEESAVRSILGNLHYSDLNGKWRVRFWAKAREAGARIQLTSEFGQALTVPLTESWVLYEQIFTISGAPLFPEELTYALIEMRVEGGDALVDEVYVAEAAGGHPSQFRQEALRAYRDLGIGILRILQGDDNTILDTILPRMKSRNGFGSLHEHYAACAEIGAEPYFCLPATLTREEMSFFMEYIGGPSTTPGGALRAQLGQEAPWLDVLPGVILEIGNELYNFGGYGGPDYWHDLVETGENSPYYRPDQVRIVLGSQGDALEYAQNAKGHAIGAYICWGFSAEGYEKYLKRDEDLLRWAVADAIGEVRVNTGERSLRAKFEKTQQLGVELFMYEGNYHTNFGTGPSDPRNRLITSAAGQLNFINMMLTMMKELGIRRQAYFKDVGFGHRFSGESAFGSEEAGFVRVWGCLLNIEEGRERYRPGALALKLANQTLKGDLVATRHEGVDPTFSFTGEYPRRIRELRPGNQITIDTIENVPELFSYAFADGNDRSLILVNLSPTDTRSVEILLPSDPVGESARAVILRGKHFFSNNEPELPEPDVGISTITLESFQDGQRMDLPPATMTTIHWTTR